MDNFFLKMRNFFWVVLLLAAPAFCDTDIVVKGLFKDGAVAEINGKQRVLKVGKRSPEGVLLISADSTKAVAEIDGQQRELTLDKSIGGSYAAPPKPEIRIASGQNGHYRTPGRINNRPVSFMVDTGASFVAMNDHQAQSLGLQFRRGQVMDVGTANGTTRGYKVMLYNVSVGEVTVNNVEAVVIEGFNQNDILLGNSYLSRIDMRVDQGVLVLQTKF